MAIDLNSPWRVNVTARPGAMNESAVVLRCRQGTVGRGRPAKTGTKRGAVAALHCHRSFVCWAAPIRMSYMYLNSSEQYVVLRTQHTSTQMMCIYRGEYIVLGAGLGKGGVQTSYVKAGQASAH
jgi:hypothetical protein